MKKIIAGLIAAVALFAATLTQTGCDIAPAQVQVIAQNAGLFAAVGWIATDNPDTNAMAAVEGILDLVREKAATVDSGTTYLLALFPVVEEYVDANVEKQYKPIATAGAMTILGGIDTLFAVNPTWKEQEAEVLKVVTAFVLGAKSGLSLADNDPIMQSARATSAARAKAFAQ